MESKGWPWKKKSSEKAMVETDGINGVSSKSSNGELVAEKIELEKEIKSLNDKLNLVMAECKAKDNLVKKHEIQTQEALIGWEKTKAEEESLKKKLEEALKGKDKSDERLSHMDAGLKECMQQLRFVREEQERRMHDALTKSSEEYEQRLVLVETELVETCKKLAEVEGENNQLTKALLAKNKALEDLNVLVSSLESKEKENVSLRYEVRVLEKELELRNEEREFSRRTSEASHKLHLENVKKVAKLESECQRLRILVRKRLPGPAALSKMRNEVDMLGRRRINGSLNPVTMESEKISNLTEQLCLLEEENKTLREALNKKVNELQFSRTMYSKTATKLLEFESNLEESSKGTNMEASRSSNVSEFDNDDKVSCADSWASALLSELENFKKKKQMTSSLVRTPKALEMKLMDDFAEMEKLAMDTNTIVNGPGSSPMCSDSISATGPLENESNENSSDVRVEEINPGSDYSLNLAASPQDIKSDSMSKLPHWLQIIVKAILEQKHISGRNTDEVLEDIRKALLSLNHSSSNFSVDVKTVMDHSSSEVATQVSSKPAETLIMEDKPEIEETGKEMEYDISKSIRRIIKIIDGVSLKDETEVSEMHSGYTARVLQWKTSELSTVLQQFLHICYDLLDRKADITKFAEEVSSLLDWTVNHCFSLQDVSSMREEIKKQFEWDESRSESEVEIGVIGQISETDKLKKDDVNDQLIIDKPENHKLPGTMIEEAAKLHKKTERDSVNELKLDEKQNMRAEFEITAASEKLAECQETILNLGKQLKALTNSKETTLLSDILMSDFTDKPNNIIAAQPSQETKLEKKLTTQRSSLLDQMKAEDDTVIESKNSQKLQAADKKGKGGSVGKASVYNETIEALEHILLADKSRGSEANSFAIVPQKKSGGVKSLWRKLLGRKKKGKKLPVPFAT